MLLTLPQPSSTEFSFRPAYDYPKASPYAAHRHSPKSIVDRSTSHQNGSPAPMSTSHRGLPPPAAMTLPELGRPPPTPTPPHNQALGSMPAPPSQWQGAEDSMRNWLSTKAEEERRRQEEERTRQESLRLEQRRVEQAMLRESMQGGIPPQMIPMIFAGIGGSNLVNTSLEHLQQYAAQLQSSQQHLQALESSQESRREGRMINQPQPSYGNAAPPPPALPAHVSVVPPPPMTQHQNTFPAYNPALSPQSRNRILAGGPTSAPRSAAHAALPRLTTNEMSVHQPPAASGTTHPMHQSQGNPQDQHASSPSIYFHHWIPPNSQDIKPGQPPTPSGRNDPGSAHPSNETDFRDSPRKRKAVGDHKPVVMPPQTSPSFSVSSKQGRNSHSHGRARSNTSTKDPSESARQTPSRRDSVATSRASQPDMMNRSYDSAAAPAS